MRPNTQSQPRDDDAMFHELVRQSNDTKQDDSIDPLQHGISDSIVRFLKGRFGSISGFYTSDLLSIAQGPSTVLGEINGFSRLDKLRVGLAALDRGGWERSYHQRLFHDSFTNAIARVFFKTDPPGSFERSYPRLLEANNWKSVEQVCPRKN